MESLQTITEFPVPLKGAKDQVTTLTSLPKDMAEVLQHMKPNQNKDLNHLRAAEPEKIGGADKDEAEDVSCDRRDAEDHHHEEEEEEDDYDEVVVNQTPLNEVTSMTDRTSPWTSVLSDPDLASLESGEQAEDLVDLNLGGSGGTCRREGVGEEDSSSLVGSGEDASDMDSDSEDVTLQDVPQELSEEEEEKEEGPSATVEQAKGSQDGGQQVYPFSLLPNTSAEWYKYGLNSRLPSKTRNRVN